MSNSSILDDLPPSDSQLAGAQLLGRRAATCGFDWPSALEALDKVREEVDELHEAICDEAASKREVGGEVGDLLFAVVNVARKLEIDPDAALASANHKFEARFRFVERRLAGTEGGLEGATLEQMEAIWREAKDQG